MESSKNVKYIEQTVAAGFPNPCEDFLVSSISLDDLLISRRSSTFLIKVVGQSMEPLIQNGSLLVVDKSITAINNSIVIAVVDNEFIVKQLILNKNSPPVLYSHNADFKDIIIDEGNQDNTYIWGCVTSCINRF